MTSEVQKYQHRASTDQLTVRGRDASPAATTAIGCEEPTLKAKLWLLNGVLVMSKKL